MPQWLNWVELVLYILTEKDAREKSRTHWSGLGPGKKCWVYVCGGFLTWLLMNGSFFWTLLSAWMAGSNSFTDQGGGEAKGTKSYWQ